MTSSDATLLPPGAKESAAARVRRSVDGAPPPGTGVRPVRLGIACAEFNGGITYRLLTGALDAVDAADGGPGSVTVAWAPGAFELPLVASALVRSGTVDAVVCLGAVIRGDTGHYDFVAGQCAAGLQRVQLDTGVPVVFGVLTTETVEQALARSEGDATNKGHEAVTTAVGMVRLLTAIASGEG